MNKFISTSLVSIMIFAAAAGCGKKDNTGGTSYFNKEGKYNRYTVERLEGFSDMKSSILSQTDMSVKDFNKYSVLEASQLDEPTRTKIKTIREDGVVKPATNTIMQKVIPLENVASFMNNENGMVGGFVCSAGDVKMLKSQTDIIEGMRLDYEGTKFKKDGGGYAVVRFMHNIMNKLSIPFSPAMGGTTLGDPPFTGTGFTASLLNDGGYPEYKYDQYFTPTQGAELFVVTPSGKEILRSQFVDGRWQTYEGTVVKSDMKQSTIQNGYYARYNDQLYQTVPNEDGTWTLISDEPEDRFALNPLSGRYTLTVSAGDTDIHTIETHARYNGHDFFVIGETVDSYLLRTYEYDPSFDVIEKGVYGLTVPKENIISDIYEIIK